MDFHIHTPRLYIYASVALGPAVVESRKLALTEITNDAREQWPDDGYYTCATRSCYAWD